MKNIIRNIFSKRYIETFYLMNNEIDVMYKPIKGTIKVYIDGLFIHNAMEKDYHIVDRTFIFKRKGEFLTIEYQSYGSTN